VCRRPPDIGRGAEDGGGPGAGGTAGCDNPPAPTLVKALARAFRYQRLLDEGRYGSISEIASAERLERGYLGTLLRLSLLTPDLVEAILDYQQPDRVTPPGLMEPLPTSWAKQRVQFGVSTRCTFGPRHEPHHLHAR
jgi:hypothetical protein